jgi:hypothetical protein
MLLVLLVLLMLLLVLLVLLMLLLVLLMLLMLLLVLLMLLMLLVLLVLLVLLMLLLVLLMLLMLLVLLVLLMLLMLLLMKMNVGGNHHACWNLFPPMPSRRYDGAKPWAARVQLGGVVHWLGYYARRSEAEAAQQMFKQELTQITMEAHNMWKKQLSFHLSVARVRDNAAAN